MLRGLLLFTQDTGCFDNGPQSCFLFAAVCFLPLYQYQTFSRLLLYAGKCIVPEASQNTDPFTSSHKKTTYVIWP